MLFKARGYFLNPIIIKSYSLFSRYRNSTTTGLETSDKAPLSTKSHHHPAKRLNALAMKNV
ncbi:hypothetical protein D4100_21740 [Serratia inhibens]|uniref:Uncharacterized protein n=1 Tax=Serratia inhibens TaxID=2338073 RepID=A0AA93BUW5_9GAMM|nr:hypothetical protein [Serratia inhibens]RJF53517.1 hypothetical protein D4100_21740 [Serratia inhibens]